MHSCPRTSRFTAVLFGLGLGCAIPYTGSAQAPALAAPGDGVLAFEVNRGQFDQRVRYAGRTPGGSVYLTDSEAVYVLPMPDAGDRHQQLALRMRWLGASERLTLSAGAPLPQHSNYLRGNDPAQWQTDVPSFASVRYDGLYPGVSMVWTGKLAGNSQYDFVLAPQADASAIALKFEGAESLQLDSNGNLLIHTAAGTLTHTRPVSYQVVDGRRRPVQSGFTVDGLQVGFNLGSYDRSLPVTIDPTVELQRLAFSTFLGGTGNEQGDDLVVDRMGNIYVTGSTRSAGFPTTAGVFDPSFAAADDVFVTKLAGSGASLIYSTFIGDSGNESGTGIDIDDSGQVYLTGPTSSPGFPTTPGAYDTSFNGNTDIFVLKLSAGGNALVYSTFIGSGGFDESVDLVRDSSNNVIVAGRSVSGNPVYPTTANAFDTSFNGTNDVIVSKLAASGANLLYSTFLGGSANDAANAMALGADGQVYVTGFSAASGASATDYPTTPGAFQTLHAGQNDIFVSRINTAQSGAASLVYSTFIGGTSSDSANGIALDPAGNAVIAGMVLSGGGYPIVVGAYDNSPNGALDVVVTALNPTGSALVYSTYIGGSGSEVASAIQTDRAGNTHLTGYTIDAAVDYPTTAGAYSVTHAGGHDVFMSKLSANGSTLQYSTLIGGLGDDDGQGLALDSAGNVYLTGQTAFSGTQFPTTLIGYQVSNGGSIDAFVSKFGSHAISGQVIDPDTGNPVAGVMVTQSGVTSDAMQTGADGRFGFVNTLTFAPYTIAASRTNYNVNPNLFTFNLDAARELMFLATPGLPSMIADLAISKSNGQNTVVAGSQITYTTLASNLGGNNAVGGTLVDSFPPELSCTWTCVGLAGGVCTGAGSGSVNDSVSLPAGGSVIYTAHCLVSAQAAGSISSSASVAPPSGVTDPLLGNNSVTDTDNVIPDALLRDGFE